LIPILYSPEGLLTNCLEVIEMHCTKLGSLDKVKIYDVKISQDDSGCYTFSVKHTGQFNLGDYEKLEFEVKSARLVRKKLRFKCVL
jgi:hypothetical protein